MGAGVHVRGAVVDINALPTRATLGDIYITENDGQGYVWAGTTFNGIGHLRGPDGPTGPSGATGATGVRGPSGAEGVTGPRGPSGATGSAGSAGAPGPTGPIGPTGSRGATGATGSAASGGKVVGEWKSTSNVGGFAGQDYHIGMASFPAEPGKKYLILISVNGFLNGQHGRKYRLFVGGHLIAEQEIKAHRGGSNMLLSMSVVMNAVHTVGSSSHPNALLTCLTEAGDTDWILDNGYHSITVLELGA